MSHALVRLLAFTLDSDAESKYDDSILLPLVAAMAPCNAAHTTLTQDDMAATVGLLRDYLHRIAAGRSTIIKREHAANFRLLALVARDHLRVGSLPSISLSPAIISNLADFVIDVRAKLASLREYGADVRPITRALHETPSVIRAPVSGAVLQIWSLVTGTSKAPETEAIHVVDHLASIAADAIANITILDAPTACGSLAASSLSGLGLLGACNALSDRSVFAAKNSLSRILLAAMSGVSRCKVVQVSANTSTHWAQIHAILPTTGPLLAIGGWCEVSDPSPLDLVGQATWLACSAAVEASAQIASGLYHANRADEVLAGALTDTAALAKLIGDTSSHIDAAAIAISLARVGAVGSPEQRMPLVRAVANALLASIGAAGGTTFSADNFAAAGFALVSIVASLVRDTEGHEGDERAQADRILDRLLYVFHGSFTDQRMGLARMGLAFNLAHLMFILRLGRWAERIAGFALQLLHDSCWDLALSRDTMQAAASFCGGAAPRARSTTRAQVVALLPAVGSAIWGLTESAERAFTWHGPAFRDRQDLPGLGGRASGLDTGLRTRLVACSGCEPEGYDAALELLDSPDVSRFSRHLTIAWVILVIIRAEEGLGGVDGGRLGLDLLARASPALIQKPGYQVQEARVDIQVLLDRVFGGAVSGKNFVQMRKIRAGTIFCDGYLVKKAAALECRDVARLAAMDMLNLARRRVLQSGRDVPSIDVLTACVAELLFSVGHIAPFAAQMLSSVIDAYAAGLNRFNRQLLPPQSALRVMDAAKLAALTLIAQISGAVTLSEGERTTAPPPEKSGIAISRALALQLAELKLIPTLVENFPTIIYSERCLAALLNLTIGSGVTPTKASATKDPEKLAVSKKITLIKQQEVARRVLRNWIEVAAHFAPDTMESDVHNVLVHASIQSSLADASSMMSVASEVCLFKIRRDDKPVSPYELSSILFLTFVLAFSDSPFLRRRSTGPCVRIARQYCGRGTQCGIRDVRRCPEQQGLLRGSRD